MSFITSPGVIVPPLTAGGVAYGTGGQAKVNSAGTAGQVLQSSGAGVPIWGDGSAVKRVARTSNTILVSNNNSNLISYTSGTFTQTFTAAATLGNGWFCFLQNSGTGVITLDPNGAELIDGLTSYAMYPGESRLVQCTGTEFFSVVLSPFSVTFTSSGTFVTPPGYSIFSGLLWGGGGGGGRSSTLLFKPGAGGGGACVPFLLKAAAVGVSQTITIAAGGAGISTGVSGNSGGNTTFGALATAYGGAGGQGNATFDQTGSGGGGALSAGGAFGGFSVGGLPTNTTGTNADRRSNDGFGGATGVATNVTPTGSSAYGGGAGASGQQLTPDGGASLYGGGGGGTADSGLGGVSVFGGSGGGGSTGVGDAGSGSVPSGGGGGAQTGASGSGGNGTAIIWGIA